MSIAITSLGGSGPREIMVDATTIAGTAEEIAAVIGNVDIGTIIYTAGFGEICTSPSEPGGTQTISSMFGGNGNSQKYPYLQYCIFEISDYCGTFETMYLSADSSDL